MVINQQIDGANADGNQLMLIFLISGDFQDSLTSKFAILLMPYSMLRLLSLLLL
jgi:hypothetical protein